jgi:putative nucleotidyltransferase with HDIG domain
MSAANTQESLPANDQRAVVLVVDDEKGPRESLRMILSSDYRVVTADGVNVALEILRSQPIDLVTLDLNMPGIRGDKLVVIMRREFPEIEVIIITGFATVDAAVRGIRSGVSDFLTKPFDVVQVNTAVGKALHKRQEHRRLVRFLEGLGDLEDRDRTTEEILDALEGNRELTARLSTLLEDPQSESPAACEEVTEPPAIEFIKRLADTIASRDPKGRSHPQRVSFYAGLIADHMKLDASLRQHIRLAAYLHDIGRAGDVAPVAGPPSHDTTEEHPSIGDRLLQPLGLPKTITDAVRHHHEHFDGTGYPDGLRADATPLPARIIAVTDTSDAIVCESSSFPHDGRQIALAELKPGSRQPTRPGDRGRALRGRSGSDAGTTSCCDTEFSRTHPRLSKQNRRRIHTMNSFSSSSAAFALEGDEPQSGVRSQPRRNALRRVDYSAFPRMSLDADKRLGLMLNESDSGLCLAASSREEVGTLLRVMVRGLHGRVSRDVVARVVWSKETTVGRYRLGLALLRETRPQMMRVRYEALHRTRSTGE